MNILVKEFWKSISIDWHAQLGYDQNLVAYLFLTTVYNLQIAKLKTSKLPFFYDEHHAVVSYNFSTAHQHMKGHLVP